MVVDRFGQELKIGDKVVCILPDRRTMINGEITKLYKKSVDIKMPYRTYARCGSMQHKTERRNTSDVIKRMVMVECEECHHINPRTFPSTVVGGYCDRCDRAIRYVTSEDFED